MTILVVGATGLVGSRVVEQLLTQQQEIRVLVRGKSDWKNNILPQYRRSGIDVMIGDIRDEAITAKAVAGCNAVINCSGLMRGSDEEVYAINADGTTELVAEAQAAGVQRFIQVSCLGATEHSTAAYFKSKWQGENAVRSSKFYWTVFRPSLIFGPGSCLEETLAFWVKRAPFIVVVGSGLNRFQPVSADIVANCIVQSLFNRDCVGQTYEVVGPESVDLASMLSFTADAYDRPNRLIKIPSFLGIKIASLFAKLNPRSPIDGQVMSIFTAEMLGDHRQMLEKFQVAAIPFRASLKGIASNQ